MHYLEKIRLTLENDREFYNNFINKMECKGISGRMPRNGFRGFVQQSVDRLCPTNLTILEREKLVFYFYERYHEEVFGEPYRPIKSLDQQAEEIVTPLETATTHFKQVSTKLKEKIDMVKLIENKTFVKGEDAAKMSDEDIFTAIAEVEAEVKKLSEVKTQSKKLQDRIAKLQEQATALATYVDNR